jgi:hypothetical protein
VKIFRRKLDETESEEGNEGITNINELNSVNPLGSPACEKGIRIGGL